LKPDASIWLFSGSLKIDDFLKENNSKIISEFTVP